MKKFSVFCIVVLLLAVLTAAVSAQDKAQWTVMFYLCGTDLESENLSGAASYNLTEISKTRPNSAVNMVIQTGGTLNWKSEEALGFTISSEEMERRVYTENGFELVGSVPNASMGNPDTLSDFITWAAANYPAEKYALLLWDHGGGPIYGIFKDELFGGEGMTIPEVSQALEDSGVHFEAIIYDACLMSSLEVALKMAPYANYMISSQETVPGLGTNFTSWLQYLYDRPECDGARFGWNFCDNMQQKYAEFGGKANSATITFAVIDLSKVRAVADAFEALISEVGEFLPDPARYSDYAYFTKRTEVYGKSSNFGLFDLGDLAENAKGSGIRMEIANALEDAVDDAVLYQIKGSSHSYSHGLSFFYGQNALIDELDTYAALGVLPGYIAFLDAVREDWDAPEWVYQQVEKADPIPQGAYDVQMEVTASEDGEHAELQITNAVDAVLAVDYQLSLYNEEDCDFLLFGRSHDVEGDFETGQFYDRFKGLWTTVGNHYCDLQIADETNTTVIYNIPILFSGDDSIYYLRAGFIYDDEISAEVYGRNLNGSYQVYGVWEGYDSNSGFPGRDVIDVAYLGGTEILNVLPIIDPKTSKIRDYFTTDVYVIDEDFDIDLAGLPYGIYGMNFVVIDVFNYEYVTPMLIFEFTEDGVKYYTPEESRDFINAATKKNHKLN